MSKQVKSYYEASRYLGQYIGQMCAFLKLTACMGLERRKQIALLQWVSDLEKKGIDINKLDIAESIEKVLIPLMELLGWAEWPRDTVTDMAIKRALTSEDESFVSTTTSSEVSKDS